MYYLSYKGVAKNKFYLKTGLSTGFLDKGNSLGVDKLRIIIDNYHDLNPLWLITGKGEMLLENTNTPTNPLNGVSVDKFDISPEAELQNSEFKNAEENVEWYRKLVEIQQKTIDEGIVLQKDMMAQLNGNRLTIEKLIAIIKKNQDKQINNDIG